MIGELEKKTAGKKNNPKLGTSRGAINALKQSFW